VKGNRQQLFSNMRATEKIISRALIDVAARAMQSVGS